MAMVVVDEATSERLETVLDSWRQDRVPFHLLAFLPEAERGRVADLQACCRKVGVALGGALFPQLIHACALRDQGAVLLRVAAGPPPLLIEDIAAADVVERASVEAVAYVESNSGESDAALFSIFDALVPNIATHLDHWYLKLADRVRYLGVNAGNERSVSEPCLFDADRFVANGVLLQLLPNHPGACLEHGYTVPAQAITATSALGNSIVQINWRPALDVYREIMQDHYGITITRENFYTHAVHFPFGILRAHGEVLVRIPVALGENGEIICVGEIKPNSLLTLLDARTGTGRAAPALAADLAQLEGAAPGGDLVLFYCAGRRLHNGAAVREELSEVARETGAGQVAGALSLGEIGGARSDDYPLFHNATLLGVPWQNR